MVRLHDENMFHEEYEAEVAIVARSDAPGQVVGGVLLAVACYITELVVLESGGAIDGKPLHPSRETMSLCLTEVNQRSFRGRDRALRRMAEYGVSWDGMTMMSVEEYITLSNGRRVVGVGGVAVLNVAEVAVDDQQPCFAL